MWMHALWRFVHVVEEHRPVWIDLALRSTMPKWTMLKISMSHIAFVEAHGKLNPDILLGHFLLALYIHLPKPHSKDLL